MNSTVKTVLITAAIAIAAVYVYQHFAVPAGAPNLLA